MMVFGRWGVAAIVVVSLAPAAASPSQTTSHRAKTKVVQPDQGAPPEQAVSPDDSTPLAQSPNYDPPPPPPRPADPEPPPPPVVLPQDTAAPALQALETPPPVRLRAMTPEELQLEKDSTRLLTLARELREEVEKAGIDTLSLSAVRKADEIQQLSKTLKERLRLQSQVVSTKAQ